MKGLKVVLPLSLMVILGSGIAYAQSNYDRQIRNQALANSLVDVSVKPPPKTTFYEKLLAHEPFHGLVIGDSIGQGAGADPHDTWVNVLSRQLESKYSSVPLMSNMSVGGATVLGGLVDFNALRKFGPDPLDVVYICFGQNDQGLLPVDQYYRIYEQLIREVKEERGNPEIFLIIESPISIQAYPDAVYALAKQYNLQVADLRPIFKGKPELTPDTVHPNKEGHQLYANELFRLISSNYDSGKQTTFEAPSTSYSGLILTEGTTNSITGTYLAVKMSEGPTSGQVTVIVDDKSVKTLNLSVPVTRSNTYFISKDLGPGPHKVSLTSDKPYKVISYISQ